MKRLTGIYGAVLFFLPLTAITGEIKPLPDYKIYKPLYLQPGTSIPIAWPRWRPVKNEFLISPAFALNEISFKTGSDALPKKFRLSSVIVSNKSLDQIGIEMQIKKFHFSGFYEMLKSEQDLDSSDFGPGRWINSGSRYGIKGGYGNADNFINLNYARKTDGLSEMPANPLVTEILGLDFMVSFKKVALFTGSIQRKEIFSDYHSDRPPEWAVESSFSLDLKNFKSLISYRRIKPEFQSKDSSFIQENLRTVDFSMEYQVNQKLRVSPSLAYACTKENNGVSMTTNRFTSGLNIHYEPSEHLMFDIQASTTSSTVMTSGSYETTDNMTETNRNEELSLSSVYLINKGDSYKTISGNLTMGLSHFQAPYQEKAEMEKNISASLEYSQLASESRPGFNIGAAYNQSDQTYDKTSSVALSAGADSRTSETKKIKLNGNVHVSYDKSEQMDPKGTVNISWELNCRYGKHEVQISARHGSAPYFSDTDPDGYLLPDRKFSSTMIEVSYIIHF